MELADKSIRDLNILAAYNKGEVITNYTQIVTPLETNKMDAEWRERVTQSQAWAVGYKGPIPDYLKETLELRNRLLTFGGEEVCMPFVEADLEKIQSRGQLWLGDLSTMMVGQRSQCHRNSALLWEANKDVILIATGYALSEDGMWRQHTWCIMINDENTYVVETTTPRVAYFGFVMNLDESQTFLYQNE